MSEVKKLGEVKLTTNELDSLKLFVENVNKIQIQIGGIEAHKHELLHAIALKNTDLRECQEQLKEKYGNVNIDLNTGIITDAPDS
tara:strand:+ start:169 stop:423 length:255 start_codon:yes stop_codon:yes gene_type:complete